jgi:DNA-binding GntR family transcriptional regulator
MVNKFIIKSHKSKTELVYETIKQSIIECKWKPGERRNADEIAKSLGVSRTPVIAASKLLETEGLLTILPQVGLEVPSTTKEGVEEIFYIRGALSGLATEHACEYIEKKDLEKLEDLIELMDRCVKNKNFNRFAKLNREFHYCIFSKCKLENLLFLLSRYWDSGSRYAQFFKYLPDMMMHSSRNHRDILEALRRKDRKAARAYAEKDTTNFGLAIVKFLIEKGFSKEIRSK